MRAGGLSGSKWRTEVISSQIDIESKSNLEKDELIDSLQLRIGELLKNVEELSTAKNQIQYLKESIVRQQEQFEIEKKQLVETVGNLEERLRSDSGATETQTLQIQELSEENTALATQVRELKQTLVEKEKVFETTNRKLQSQLDLRVSELEMTVTKRDKEITVLRSEIETLKSKQTEQNSSIFQQKLETEKVKNTISHLEADKQWQSERIQELKHKLQIRKEQVKRIETTNKELTMQIAARRLDCQNMKHRESEATGELEEREKEVELLKQTIRKALAMPPGFTTFESIAEYLKKLQKERNTFEEEMIRACNIIKKVKRKLTESCEQNESLKKELDYARQSIASQEKELEKCKVELGELRKMTSRQNTRMRAIPVIEKTHVMLKRYLTEINDTVCKEPMGPAFKTLIALSVMLLRWKRLPGTEQVYATDARNWWWIGNGPNAKVLETEVVNHVTELNAEIASAKQTIQQQQATIHSMEDKIERLQASSAEIQAKYNAETQQTAKLQEQIESMQADFTGKIDADEHEVVVKQLEITKAKLKRIKKAYKENTMEVTNLQISLAKTKCELNTEAQKNANLVVQNLLGTSQVHRTRDAVQHTESYVKTTNSARFRKKFDVPDHLASMSP